MSEVVSLRGAMLPAANAKNLNQTLTYLRGPAPGASRRFSRGVSQGPGKANVWISQERLSCEVNG